MATINPTDDPRDTATSFRIAAEQNLKVNWDIGFLIARSRPVEKLKVEYAAQDGTRRTKTFEGKHSNKMMDFYPDEVIQARLSSYLRAIAPHKSALYSVFLVDEPYLNGVSKAELERISHIVRATFAEYGFPEIKLGVLFAGAMFNKEFAETTQKAALAHADAIDTYAAVEDARISSLPLSEAKAARVEFEKWKEIISSNRLTTYDIAGNMYANGGIPSGFDILAFDLYISTALLDSTYEDSMAVLAAEAAIPECEDFINVKMSKFRATLSFMQSGPMSAGDHLRDFDDGRLTRFYNCRVKATVKLLHEEAIRSGYSKYETMVVTEASSNGLLEFSADGSPETEQPGDLIKKRVKEEVERALALYREPNSGIDHMLFFTFDDEYDFGIKLQVGGVASNREAIEAISAASERAKR